MTGVPRFEERECFGAAYLADDYSIGAQPHGRPYQPRHVRGLGGVELDEVLGAALDFEGVLDDHVALVRIGTLDHFVDERARQRGLARAGPARDYDAAPRIDGFTQDAGVRVAQDLVAYVIVERVKDLGRLAHDATRLSGNRRKESLETDSFDQEFAFNNRID